MILKPTHWVLFLFFLLNVSAETWRIFLPINLHNKTTLRALAVSSARLPAPTGSRLYRSGSTAVASVENAAASATTVAHRFLLPLRNGRAGRGAGSGSVGGFVRARRSIGRIGVRGALVARLASDVLAAMASSLMVSPLISIVDRSIIQGASGTMGMKSSLVQGLRVMVAKPALFSSRPDFICTFFLYAATYLAANWITTIASESSCSDTLPKFVGTTAVNMPGSIAKDQALTKLFGVVNGAAKVPAASFALFTMRDVATMAAAFTLPTPMSTKMQEDFGVGSSMADGVSQLVSPGLIQLFCTPVHLLGLDLYNHPRASLAARLRVVQQSFVPAMLMRVCRIGVAFGVGGLGNTAIRKHFHGAIDVEVRAAAPSLVE